MAVDRARLSAMRQALQSGDSASVISELQNLNTLLEATPSSADVLEMASFISLPIIFSCLSTSEERQVETCCPVLEKIFSCMSPAELGRYGQYIEIGLQHTASCVRTVSLKVLKKNLSSPEVQALVVAPTMFHLLTQVIGDDSLECAQLTLQIVEEVVTKTSPMPLDDKMKQALLLDLQGLMDKNDTVRYRVYELAVHMSLTGGEMFAFVNSSGLLTRLVSELDSEDVLVRMNCLELLVQLLESEEGAGHLEEAKVLQRLHVQLTEAQRDPFGSFVIPGIIKYFGHFSVLKGADLPGACRDYPEFLAVVLETVRSAQEDTLLGVAMDTLGVLGSTVAGRKALENYGTQTADAIKCLGRLIANAMTDVRIRALDAAAMLLSCKEEETEDSKSHEWFKVLFSSFSILLSMLQQPFRDLKLTCLRFLLSIAPQQWAQVEMHAQPGFLEYLLNRRTEADKEGKELKYEVVHALVVSGTAEEVFGGPDLLKLRQYDMEGAFFVCTETMVATEGSV